MEGDPEKVCKNCCFYEIDKYECRNMFNYTNKMFPLCSCTNFLKKEEALTIGELTGGILSFVKKNTETIKERIKEARSYLAGVFSRKE